MADSAEQHEAEAPLFAVGAEFATPDALLAAVHALRGRRFGRLDAYTPVPVPGLADALEFHPETVRPFAVSGVVLAFAVFMAMCIYATGYAYKLNIGGRPDISWQSYIVPSFAFSLMVAAILVVLAMVVLNRLPRLTHPAFNIPDFTRASQDRFFLAIEADGDRFDIAAVTRALERLALRPVAIHQTTCTRRTGSRIGTATASSATARPCACRCPAPSPATRPTPTCRSPASSPPECWSAASSATTSSAQPATGNPATASA